MITVKRLVVLLYFVSISFICLYVPWKMKIGYDPGVIVTAHYDWIWYQKGIGALYAKPVPLIGIDTDRIIFGMVAATALFSAFYMVCVLYESYRFAKTADRDRLLEGINFQTDVGKVIGALGEWEKEHGAKLPALWQKQFSESIGNFLANPCKETATKIIDAVPGIEQAFISLKKKRTTN